MILNHFFSKLPSDTVVLVCKHALQNPDQMRLVYCSEEGQVSCVCEEEHDMESAKDFRWLHAGHIEEYFPQTKKLAHVPRDHVAMFFYDYDGWVVDSLIDE